MKGNYYFVPVKSKAISQNTVYLFTFIQLPYDISEKILEWCNPGLSQEGV